MKIVIIGFGSIGQRHYRILSKIYDPKNIFVLTKQSIKIKNKLKNLKDITKFWAKTILKIKLSFHSVRL